MRRFVFRLARLERLRELQRSRARAGLARAAGEARAWRERAEGELQSLERPSPLDAREDDEPVDAALLHADARWREGCRRLAGHAREKESEAREDVRMQQLACADASRRHRVVERLREKRHDRWRIEAEREERTFLDEVHTLRLLRARREAPTEEEIEP